MHGAASVKVTDSCPTLLDYDLLARGARIELDGSALNRVAEAHRTYIAYAASHPVYGFSTGVGALQHKPVNYDQEVLVLEHAAGAGPYLDPDVARLVVVVRLVQLSRGRSPVRPVVIEFLAEMVNRGIVPAIPVYGSVGASGDLAPLAHLVLTATGRGQAFYRGKLVKAYEALKEEGLEPVRLEKGEALSLINGTAFSTAILIYSLLRLARLVDVWVEVVGIGLGLATYNPEHYSPEAFTVKAHRVPRQLAEKLWKAVSSVEHPFQGKRLQDPYSMRCFVQALTAFYQAWSHVAQVAVCEACSPSDNPVVADGRVIHQCSFHGINVGLAADYAAVAVAALANCAERRIAQLLERLDSKPFLGDARSPHGLMIAHYTAASLTAMIRQQASPHTVHNIPTSGLQEDFVSMSSHAALRLLNTLDALETIAAIEALTVARLSHLLGVEPPGWLADLAAEASKLGEVEVASLISSSRKKMRRAANAATLPGWAVVGCPAES